MKTKPANQPNKTNKKTQRKIPKEIEFKYIE